MASPYTNEEREEKRIKFAQKRRKEHSIEACCEAADISVSTFYAWDGDGGWSKDGGWNK
mgnify:CR=1 FL=1